MVAMIVEQSFAVAVTPEEMNVSARKLDDCLSAHGARWIRSYVSLDRKRVVCEFEAADAEKVRESYRSAGVEFDRVWTADVFSTDAPSSSYER